jgi:hypothetical protein
MLIVGASRQLLAAIRLNDPICAEVIGVRLKGVLT